MSIKIVLWKLNATPKAGVDISHAEQEVLRVPIQKWLDVLTD